MLKRIRGTAIRLTGSFFPPAGPSFEEFIALHPGVKALRFYQSNYEPSVVIYLQTDTGEFRYQKSCDFALDCLKALPAELSSLTIKLSPATSYASVLEILNHFTGLTKLTFCRIPMGDQRDAFLYALGEHPCGQRLTHLGMTTCMGDTVIPSLIQLIQRMPKLTSLDLSQHLIQRPESFRQLSEYAVHFTRIRSLDLRHPLFFNPSTPYRSRFIESLNLWLASLSALEQLTPGPFPSLCTSEFISILDHMPSSLESIKFAHSSLGGFSESIRLKHEESPIGYAIVDLIEGPGAQCQERFVHEPETLAPKGIPFAPG